MKLLKFIQRAWDWWIYNRSTASFRRLFTKCPSMGYLVELRLRDWNNRMLPDEHLRKSAETFHNAMRDLRERQAAERQSNGAGPDGL